MTIVGVALAQFCVFRKLLNKIIETGFIIFFSYIGSDSLDILTLLIVMWKNLQILTRVSNTNL